MTGISVSSNRPISDSPAAKAARVAILAAFPLSLTSPGTTVAMALTALLGLYLWARAGAMPRDIAFEGALAAGGYLLLLTVDVINGGGLINFIQTGVNYLPVLALAPLALAIRMSGVTTEMIDRALQLTVTIALAVSVTTWLAGAPRPGGLNLNPIPYGFAVLLSASLLLWRGIGQGNAGRLSVILALLATVPILLTGSKIVWACTIVSYGTALAYWIVANRRWKTAVPVLAAILPFLALIYVSFARTRIEAFWAELREYAGTGVSLGQTFGHRIEMAASAWRAFLDRPVFGYGFDERMDAAFDYTTPGGPDITIHNHLHNDYVTHLVSYGTFGGLFLALYCAFFLRQAAMTNVPAYRRAGYVYVLLLLMYMSVEVAFNMDPVSGPLAMLLALLLAHRVDPQGYSDKGKLGLFR